MKTFILKGYTVIFLLLTIMFFSCEKTEVKEVEKSKKELLTNTEWAISAINFNNTNLQLPTCLQDDKYSFDATKITANAGTEICKMEAESATGTWTISSDETKINIEGANLSALIMVIGIEYHDQQSSGSMTIVGNVKSFDIITLSETTLKIKSACTYNGEVTDFAITFSKIK